MRVLIVEDETAAYENLVDILGEVSYDIQIVGNLPFLIKWSWKLLLFSRRLMTDTP